MAHLTHRMHENSVEAYHAEEAKLSKRATAVLDWITVHGPHTDREVMQGMGFAEPNAVRPRLTELVDAGKLIEVCTRKCPVTGKRVRVLDIARPRGQGALFS
jgi:dihydrodipicolinate synthase/N-acetylneuraminate lyase